MYISVISTTVYIIHVCCTDRRSVTAVHSEDCSSICNLLYSKVVVPEDPLSAVQLENLIFAVQCII